MDPVIAQTAADHRKAGLLGIAWHVEQVTRSLGMAHRFTDEFGDGPFMQEVRRPA